MGSDDVISVLMPVYNAERYLEPAIDSILAQTYRDYELIVVDDGSTDATVSMVSQYAARDARIKLIQQQHLGHSAALNVGLQHCQYRWVAIMDGDDIALPQRLERQLEMTKTDPEVVIWGTDGYHINARGEILSSFRVGPTSKEECRRMRRDAEIVQAIHPTVLINREVAIRAGGYDETHAPAGDIDLFDRMLQFGDLVTIPEPLIQYRIHGASLSMTKAARMAMLRRFVLARQRHRRAFGQELTLREFLVEDARRPRAVRLRDWIIMRGNLLYRQGGLYYGERRYVKAALALIGAAVLRPIHSSRRVWMQVLSPRARRSMRMQGATSPPSGTGG
jgi:GT2 family glycosyltransferase